MNKLIHTKGVNFASLIIPTGTQPLDSRTVVQSKPTKASEFTNALYLGMPIVTLDTNQMYILIDTPTLEDGSVGLTWKEVGSGSGSGSGSNVSGVLNFKGSYDEISQLGSASNAEIGDVYNIRKQFTLEEPTGQYDKDGNQIFTTRTYAAGTNVVCYNYTYTPYTKNQETGELVAGKAITEKRWDTLGGTMDWQWIEVTS